MKSGIFYLPYLPCIYLTFDLLEVCFLYIFYIVGHNCLFLLHLLNKLLLPKIVPKFLGSIQVFFFGITNVVILLSVK